MPCKFKTWKDILDNGTYCELRVVDKFCFNFEEDYEIDKWQCSLVTPMKFEDAQGSSWNQRALEIMTYIENNPEKCIVVDFTTNPNFSLFD
ncbi:MAG: hypothetical protein Sylvanvirus1_100 [Sylvanvirus sp.]|uniref:Uncharacterized protein n=1 Tax=Sylvanvirus sp. TaxID=2487774 RepID=A0A3G5AIS9_9VIRU|nr:MAG: hypothetical protein Sylvanvirus1_100 [Sylvanvirus sp.]